MKERPILFSAPMVRALLDGSKTQTRRVVKGNALDTINFFSNSVDDQDGSTEDLGQSWLGGTLKVWSSDYPEEGSESIHCPYGQPGDRLWVREAWRTSKVADELRPSQLVGGGCSPIWYEAQDQLPFHPSEFGKLRPSMFMPRWASRITLEITGVRVERLQDISEADAVAEGCCADVPETWWQGYKDHGEKLGLMHTQTTGETPPDWMIEPHKMNPKPWLVRSAKTHYETLWKSINGPESWCANPWVWVVQFKVVTP